MMFMLMIKRLIIQLMVYNDDFNSITVKKKANYSYLIYVGIGVVGIIIVGGIITKKKNMKKEAE